MARDPHIKITFQTVTPESAEDGDFAETGWEDEEGVSMKPDRYDRKDGITVVEKAVRFLQNEGVEEASSSGFHVGVWYSTGYDVMSYRTGEEKSRSFHLYDFTAKQEREIYDQMTRRRR